MDKGLEALLDVLNYNGYAQNIIDIANYIDSCDDSSIVRYPIFFNEYNCDKPIRILWSVLVVMFGDFGASPRYGWIENENKKKCLNELKSWIELHDDRCLEDE